MAKAKIPAQTASSRFLRSVNIEQDLGRPEALDGYVITAGVRRALLRIAPAIADLRAARVWTVTGPYGTGKSAFLLFLAWLFSHDALGIGAAVRRLLEACDKELATKILRAAGAKKDLLPVVVTGSREPLGLALLRGLRRSLQGLPGRKAATFRRKVEDRFAAAEKGELPATAELTALFVECLDGICDGNDAPDGLLLIVDELGKLLEHATTHVDSSDIFVLQSLAEFAARSPRPFLIIGVLHQDFSLYGQHLSPRERAEWDKVRGRFEDIAFEEPADEIMRLIAQARVQARQSGGEADLNAAPAKIQTGFNALCEEVWKLDLAPAGVTKKEFTALLRDCWPLHPLVTVLLGPLFRRLAQNERSVFSFLHSAEPGSLAEHIRDSGGATSANFTIEQLYDYLVSSLGDGLYIHARGKRWAEIETVLDRLPDASALEIAAVKTVGLLGAVGQWQQLRGTPQIIKLALAPQHAPREVDQAIKSLLSQSALVSRRYNNSLGLWEGSDVDLDVRLCDDRGFDHWLKIYNGYLPSSRMRWCTKVLKIKPFEKYVGDDEVMMYVGIRADEDRAAYISTKPNIHPVYPFKDDGVDLDGVHRILDVSGIGFPEYYKWRTRSGCYFCFFQRRNEWVGLQKEHPALYELAKAYEKHEPGDGTTLHMVPARISRRTSTTGTDRRNQAGSRRCHATREETSGESAAD
jgi:hypothetical protein